MKMPKISIIIPVYNVEEYIEECLLSVMRQTYTGEMECILVDDCGNDNSIAIAQKLILEYKGSTVFRILHHECNRGLSAARNTGTAAAIGDYIYYLDSDDYITEDCMETLAAPLCEKEYDVVMGDYKMCGDQIDPTLLLEEREEIVGNEHIFSSFSDRKIYVMAWNKLCKLSFLRDNKITFLEGQLHEDNLWTYKTMLFMQSLRIIHQVVYHYRVRANSIATDNTKAQKKAISYRDTIEYIHAHPFHITNTYSKCLLYYWMIYLDITRKNQLSFLCDYRKLRNSCPLRPIQYIFKGIISVEQLRTMSHLLLPPILAYPCLILRYNIRKSMCSLNRIFS